MSVKEKLNLIFLPNFSTKESVSEISGRGIGMDVVQKSADLLDADLDIHSVVNEGSTFSLTFSSKPREKVI